MRVCDVVAKLGKGVVGVSNTAVNVRNDDVGVRDILTNIRNSYVGVYCKLDLQANS